MNNPGHAKCAPMSVSLSRPGDGVHHLALEALPLRRIDEAERVERVHDAAVGVELHARREALEPQRVVLRVSVLLGVAWAERFYTPPPPGSNFRACQCARIETKALRLLYTTPSGWCWCIKSLFR